MIFSSLKTGHKTRTNAWDISSKGHLKRNVKVLHEGKVLMGFDLKWKTRDTLILFRQLSFWFFAALIFTPHQLENKQQLIALVRVQAQSALFEIKREIIALV